MHLYIVVASGVEVMFKAALKLTVRVLPFAAAMLASVAIGASTHAPEPPSQVASRNVVHRGAPITMQSVRYTATLLADTRGFDGPLIARADSLAMLANDYPVETLDTALTTPVPAVTKRNEAARKFDWPRPDRWTSLLATLALAAFFFLRRIV